MTTFNVHIYREMRMLFKGIEAASHEAAAAIARLKPTDDADEVEDCEGDETTALVDVVGDEEYEQSMTIDFEPERQRKAAVTLLAALVDLLGDRPDIQDGQCIRCGRQYDDEDGLPIPSHCPSDDCPAYRARAAVADAMAAGVYLESKASPRKEPPREPDEDSGTIASKLLAALTYALEFLRANDDGEPDVRSRIVASEAAIAQATAAGVTAAPPSPPSAFGAPWSLRFERDGTEDIAVISDGDGDELMTSRPFWLPQGDDPTPPTLAAMQLAVTAPRLLAALEKCAIVLADYDERDGQEGDAYREAVAAIAQATAA